MTVHKRLAQRICFIVLLQGTRVLAHSFDPALLDLRERAAGRFDVVWKLPALQAAMPSGSTPLTPHFPPHCHRLDASSAPPAPAAPSAFWQIDCGTQGLEGMLLSVSGLEGTGIDVMLRIAWLDGTSTSGVLRSGASALVVPARTGVPLAAGAPAAHVFGSYMRIGIEHILLGYDHLAFVLALCLLVESRRQLLKTITAFTVAHSLTLALAILGFVQVSPAPVEALIAFSIVLVARELIRSETDQRPRPWVIAFVFGLLHGLGFAGALGQVGLPADHIPLALLAFNLGVEIGQLTFVLVVAAPVAGLRYLFARRPGFSRFPGYAIGTLASMWTIERVVAFWPT